MTEAFYDMAGNVVLAIIAAVVLVVIGPFYLLLRLAAMCHNLSVGLPANYGFKRRF